MSSLQHYLIVWPETRRIVRHSRMPGGNIATKVFTSGEIALDPPGLIVPFADFYID